MVLFGRLLMTRTSRLVSLDSGASHFSLQFIICLFLILFVDTYMQASFLMSVVFKPLRCTVTRIIRFPITECLGIVRCTTQ